jgi:hypothetical protein
MAKKHKVKYFGAQGDVIFRKVKEIPKGFSATPSTSSVIVAHSETGHHHSVDVAGVRLYVGPDPLVAYLQLETVDSCDVVHHRTWDTHETLSLLGGKGSIWEIRRQREYTPEGWRRVQD